MSETLPPLPTLLCVGCGASLPVNPTQPTSTCPRCARVTTLPAELLERARAHAARMQVIWADELEARRTELLHLQASRLNGPLLGVILLFACSVPAWFLLGGVLAHVPLVVALLSVGFELALLAALVHGFCLMIRPPTLGLVLASGLGACPSCGGPVKLGEQAQSTRCRWCGATLLATREMQGTFMATATARLRDALTERDRAEISNWETARSARVGGRSLPLVPLGVAFVLLATCAMVGAFIWVVTSDALDTPGNTPTWWVLPALLVGGVALLLQGARRVRAAMAAKHQFEQAIGRPLQPLAMEPPRS